MNLKKPFVWSATKAITFSFCPRQYYYIYLDKRKEVKEVPITGIMAMGGFLHRRTEKKRFYDEDGNPKRKSAKAFANSAVGYWKRFPARNGTSQGRKIKWEPEKQKWYLIPDIWDMCALFYENRINEKPPLHSEKKFKFLLGDEIFEGKIDEIREGLVIRDYKTGERIPKKMELDYDPQFTFYALAFCCLSYGDPKFASMCGVDPEDAKKFPEDPNRLSEKVTLEYYHMRSGKIFKTKRSALHYEDLFKTLSDFEDRISRNQFTPQRKSCGRCLYNEICDEDTAQVIVPKSPYYQLELFEKPSKIIPDYKTLKLKFPRRKRKKISA